MLITLEQKMKHIYLIYNMAIQSITVFCGSKAGNNALYAEHATALGEILASKNVTIIYGAGNKGIMGSVANGALSKNGNVVGIIPEFLKMQEHMHLNLNETHVVEDMHIRKKILYEKGDAAIILPGGYGTMDELFEIITWNSLQLHHKPIFILNSGGFYNNLMQHINYMYNEGFLYSNPTEEITVLENPSEITSYL
jgi:uncharacterized protein (TIGR00730 family)